ncbi:hypothetical protein, partial [Aeromonas hydrophila]|uniref:hypothetical protein n=1 Tax=Aeromonas hydrophila TaxID=644 RepID=UPI003F66D952
PCCSTLSRSLYSNSLHSSLYSRLFGIICIHLWLGTTKAHQQDKMSIKQNSIAQTSTKNYQEASSDHEKAAFGTKYGH